MTQICLAKLSKLYPQAAPKAKQPPQQQQKPHAAAAAAALQSMCSSAQKSLKLMRGSSAFLPLPRPLPRPLPLPLRPPLLGLLA